ncbi:MAG TPA: DoxX family protein [Fimbriiglobus sp.]|jgi:uncharacterized membrane protein YphA (DoxX/SURF4 family)
MPSIPLTPAIIYGGLGLCLLGLLVAALQQKWSVRVFFLCALRLAIGWHFLFEGLHKIHSRAEGLTETNKPFSSEMYHKMANGPVGPYVRKYFLEDTAKLLDEKVPARPATDPSAFAKLTPAQQAALCPPAIASELETAAKNGSSELQANLTKAKTALEELKKSVDLTKAKAAADAAKAKVAPAEADAKKAEEEAEKLSAEAVVAKEKGTGAAWQAAKDKASTARAKAREARRVANETQTSADANGKKLADAKKKLDEAEGAVKIAEAKLTNVKDNGEALKVAYAAWLCGADTQDAKVKFFGNDVPQSAPDRKAHIELMKKELSELTARQEKGLGNGYTNELTRTKTSKADIRDAETDLLKDADKFVDGLKKAAGWKPDPNAVPPERTIDKVDKYTSWAITVMGACLLFGLLTRLNCVLAAGFLVMTVLEYPAVPWLPLPPNTEGNPLFVNKNVIEALALLTIATFPTGRWMGLDAIISYLLFGNKKQR